MSSETPDGGVFRQGVGFNGGPIHTLDAVEDIHHDYGIQTVFAEINLQIQVTNLYVQEFCDQME